MHAAPICSQANTRNTTNSTRGYHVAIVRPSVTHQLTGMVHAGKHSMMKDDALHPDLAEGAARGREVVNVQTDLIGHYTLSRSTTGEAARKVIKNREVLVTQDTPQIDAAETENLRLLQGRTGLRREPNAILPPENLKVFRKRTGEQPYAERGNDKTSTSIWLHRLISRSGRVHQPWTYIKIHTHVWQYISIIPTSHLRHVMKSADHYNALHLQHHYIIVHRARYVCSPRVNVHSPM